MGILRAAVSCLVVVGCSSIPISESCAMAGSAAVSSIADEVKTVPAAAPSGAKVTTEVSATPANAAPSSDSSKPTPPGSKANPAPGGGPPASGQPAAATGTPAEAGGTGTPPAAGAPVKRGDSKGPVSRPIREEIRQNPDGRIAFNLNGQPWEEVLLWLSDASAFSLDWQELPGDVLNLTTTRDYTLPEARDLINRHLLTRGYSMLLNGEILSVIKVKDLNPSLVPRVKPSELADLPDHSLCKVSFDLQWLIADEAVEELKPMLSSAGQIHKLSRTNRLEVIDTVASLRDIWNLLEDEQSESGSEQLVRVFRLQHRRAEEVLRMLKDLLGIRDEGGRPAASDNPNMMQQQIQQQMQQMQQQMQQAMQAGAKPGGAAPGRKAETRLVLNQRENMILVQAAPDQMAAIEQAILQVDVPGKSGSSLLQNLNRMKIYRMETVDPQTLADLLQQLGDLDPATVLTVDKKKKSIIAWATLADHLTITTLVERLDQSARNFDVIPLRLLEAEYVAGTIRGLLGPPPDTSDSNRNSRYGMYSYGYGSPPPEEPKERVFQIDADIENNRLLVYANTVEMEEIRHLLRKLGELPDPDRVDEGFRVFDLNPDEDLENLQQRLKQLWKRGNTLEFDFPAPPLRPAKDAPVSDQRAAIPIDQTTSNELQSPVRTFVDGSTKARPESFEELLLIATAVGTKATETGVVGTSIEGPSIQTGFSEQADKMPPVQMSVTPDGKLIVSSGDPVALRELEGMLSHMARSRRNYKVYRLQYATPSWISLTLKDYFKSEEQTKSTLEYNPWWGMVPSEKKVTGNHTLSKRRQPTFISDNYTSTILVRDADPQQYQVIQELIDLYDVPEPSDTRSMRMTSMFRLQHARANSVAAAVKDVFRDLLSANDKALESKDPNARPSGGGGGLMSFLPGNNKEKGDDEPIRFKGLLSIGVDESSNTLIVSSTATLMDTIGELIKALDSAAASSSVVQVIKVNPSVDIELIEERLNKLLSSETSKQQRRGQPGPQGPPGQPGMFGPGGPQGAEGSVSGGDAGGN